MPTHNSLRVQYFDWVSPFYSRGFYFESFTRLFEAMRSSYPPEVDEMKSGHLFINQVLTLSNQPSY